MTWQLNRVEDRECTMDDSNVYTVINRVKQTETRKQYANTNILIRVDILRAEDDEPLQSFVGEANAVRKAVISYIVAMVPVLGGNGSISAEHASYIGYEIMRAKSDDNYKQD